MSTDEILEGYCLNTAGLLYGQELQAKESEEYERFLAGGEAGVGDEDSEAEEETSDVNVNHSLNIRKRAAVLRAQLERSLSETTLQLLREETERIDEEGRDGATFGLVSKEALEAARRNRKGRSVRGGAAMNVKRALQRNLNVVSVLFFYSSRDTLPRRKLLLLFLRTCKKTSNFSSLLITRDPDRTGPTPRGTPSCSSSSATSGDGRRSPAPSSSSRRRSASWYRRGR